MSARNKVVDNAKTLPKECLAENDCEETPERETLPDSYALASQHELLFYTTSFVLASLASIIGIRCIFMCSFLDNKIRFFISSLSALKSMWCMT